QTGYLCLLCYNFGVDTYNLKKYEESSFWLRLLATVYMEWDCQQYQDKALHAVTLANKVHVLLSEIFDAKIPLEVCLCMVKLLMSENREALAFEFLKKACQHFESSPEVGSALVLHIELLLQKGKELLGKQKIEDAIAGHYTGKPLSSQTLCHLHLLLWDRASKHFEAKNYTEALQWYNYSLSFFPAGQMDQNLAKLQRNRALCFLQLQQLEKAKEAIKDAERCDPDSIFTQFSIYKISVREKDVERGNNSEYQRGDFGGKCDICVTLLSQHEQQDVAVKALESLCEHSQDAAQVLTALRSVVLTNLDEYVNHSNCSLCTIYSTTALHRLTMVITEPGMEQGKRSEEAGWFRKIAWNLALQSESSPVRMRDFFLLSYQLSQFCPPDQAVLMGQKTCLLMAAAVCLELHRKSAEHLTQALEYIQMCREVWKALRATGDFSRDPTETLLFLYEFEARAKLNDPDLEDLLETVLGMEDVETKTLETIAALAMEPPAHYPLLCKKVLRIALFLHKKKPQPDLTQCRQCIHSLIELSLPSGVSEVEPHVLEEVWGYYEEAFSLIEPSQGNFPEIETVWLLTRAWNTGILLYSLAQYPEAERWCGLSMSFLRHLHSLRESYQTKV
uniref:Protein ZIP4 homolog n=1 Tax=Scleropages formosus TaxID=113540 RepID=A0A8C9V008_SCLFO